MMNIKGDANHMKLKRIDIESIEGFKLGNAENIEQGTGCTVVICEEGAVGGVDVRGGAPATRETDLLKSENTVDKVNAVMLSGGFAFGLEAASGAMRELADKGVGFKIGDMNVPIVCGASLYDFEVGGSKAFPDIEMGREAVKNAYEGKFESGNHGAGTGASVGKMLGMHRAMKAGLGTFACSDGVVDVGAVVAVNACADIYNGAGNIIAGLRTEDGNEIYGSIKVLKGMVRPETDEESLFGEFSKVNAKTQEHMIHSPKPSHSEDEKVDIAKAIMEAYEAESNHTVEAEEAKPETEATPEAVDTTAIVTDDVPTATEPEVMMEEAPAEDVSVDTEPAVAEPVFEEPEQKTQPETVEHTEQPTEQDAEAITEEPEEKPEIIEEEILTKDEMDESEQEFMGYSIPFNTTIACIVTNAILTKSQANKLASILHDAYARAIKPVHSTMDGDTIFVLSRCTQKVNFDAFAALATDVLQYAIIDGATEAEGAYGLPAARDMIIR